MHAEQITSTQQLQTMLGYVKLVLSNRNVIQLALQALGKYGILRLHQKGQLQDIYSELGHSK